MTAAIQVLEEIQRIDLELGARLEEEKGRRKRIESLTAELAAVKEAVTRLDSEMEKIEAVRKGIQERLRENSEKIKRDEARLGEIKTEKEFKALTKEVHGAGKAVKQAEKELADIDPKFSDKRLARDGKTAEAGRIESEIENITKELEAKKREWEEDYKEKAARREGLVATLSPEVYRLYETIREKRGGRAIVQVKDEACQGCFMKIPPQVYILIKKGEEGLFTCPHCHRILFFERVQEATL